MCKHERVEPGPVQRVFSWEIPTEVCLDCNQWRPVLIPNCIWRDPPIPQGTPDDDLKAYAERLAERDLADYQGPTGDCADMRAGIVLARAYLATAELPTPRWMEKPNYPGLWVYRISNTFWVQSVMFQVHLVTEKGLAGWRPTWGDDPIVEVFGPLSMSAAALERWEANEREEDERYEKRYGKPRR